jgi:hypothetical protein
MVKPDYNNWEGKIIMPSVLDIIEKKFYRIISEMPLRLFQN